jgi:hypothetical protein
MARIFDNFNEDLLTTLRATMQVSRRADFCVFYFDLRGWQSIEGRISSQNPAQDQQGPRKAHRAVARGLIQ